MMMTYPLGLLLTMSVARLLLSSGVSEGSVLRNIYYTGRITGFCMVTKVTKSVRLPYEVAVELEEEENQSVAVENALRERYDL